MKKHFFIPSQNSVGVYIPYVVTYYTRDLKLKSHVGGGNSQTGQKISVVRYYCWCGNFKCKVNHKK